jgi:integrase
MTYLRNRMWWGSLFRANGTRRLVSLKTRDAGTAKQMQRMLDVLRDHHRWLLLDAVCAGTLTIAEVYQAFGESRHAQLEERLRAAPADDRDLEPSIARWRESLLRLRSPNPATVEVYVRQVRTLIPADKPFPRSAFTVARISEWRDGLSAPHAATKRRGASQPNRFLVALNSFAAFLVERGLIDANPVAQVSRAREAPPRDVSLHRDDAAALVAALEQPWRALHALMAGTGLEISAALKLRHGDIDAKARTVRGRGSKTASRDRTVKVTEAWAWDIVAEYVKQHRGLRDALVFGEIVRNDEPGAYAVAADASHRALAAACKVRKIVGFRQHDWRHVYAVQAIRDAMPLQLVAAQLGHRDTLMVQRVYGRYVPTASDWAAHTAKSASAADSTIPATGTAGAERGQP